MNDKIQALLFLTVIAFFILGFIFSIFYIIIKSISSNPKIRQLALLHEWYYYRNENIHSESLHNLLNKLENTLYKKRNWLNHNLTQIINGHYNKIEFWFAYYHAVSKNHIKGEGYNQNLSLYILPRTQKGSDLFLLHKTKRIKNHPVEQIVRKIERTLEVPDNKELDWILVSDKSALNQMALTDSQYHEIKNDLEEMYGIYFLDDLVIYMIHNYKSHKEILKYLDNVYRINSIVNP